MSTTTPQTWGARIRQRRLELGLTQVQVAEAADDAEAWDEEE